MNDRTKQDAIPKVQQPSLSEIIVNNLNEITDTSTNIANQLGDLERYIFGNKPCDKGSAISSDDQIESWENEVLRKFVYIKQIIEDQQVTLEAISKFHK